MNRLRVAGLLVLMITLTAGWLMHHRQPVTAEPAQPGSVTSSRVARSGIARHAQESVSPTLAAPEATARAPLDRLCRADGELEENAYKAWRVSEYGVAYQAWTHLQQRKRYQMVSDGPKTVIVAPPYDAYDHEVLKKMAGNGDAFAAGVLALRYLYGQIPHDQIPHDQVPHDQVPQTTGADALDRQQEQAERWILQALEDGEPDLWMAWMLITGNRRRLDQRDEIAEQRASLSAEAFELWREKHHQSAYADAFLEQYAIYRFMRDHGSLPERIEAAAVMPFRLDEKNIDAEQRRVIETYYQQLRKRFPLFVPRRLVDAEQREYETITREIARLETANAAIVQACRQAARSSSGTAAN